MIKKALLLFSFCFIMLSLTAQSSRQASWEIGLTGIPIIYPGIDNIGGFALTLNAGHFLTDNLAFGLRPFYGKVVSGTAPANEKISSFGANIYARWHFGTKKVIPFLDFNIGWGRLWYSSDDPDLDLSGKANNGKMFNYAVGPGVDILLSGSVHLEIIVQYLRMQNIDFPERTTVGNTVIPTIGFQKVING